MVFSRSVQDENLVSNMSVFVSIASYRDKMLTSTLISLYRNARSPQNVFCGILAQNKDSSELPDISKVSDYAKNIKVVVIPYYEAKGPLWARQLIIEKLYNKENYYLQIDSHMEFTHNWDDLLLSDLTSLPPQSLISCYPISELGKTNLVPHMISKIPYSKDTMIDKYQAKLLEPSDKPRMTAYLAAGFLFHKANLLNIYPKNKIPYLFQGEEMLLLRAYLKNGVQFYAPTRNVCSHYYIRNNEPKIWFDLPDWEAKERHALESLKMLLFC